GGARSREQVGRYLCERHRSLGRELVVHQPPPINPPRVATSGGPRTTRPTTAAPTAAVSTAAAARSFAVPARGWNSGEARSTTASMALLRSSRDRTRVHASTIGAAGARNQAASRTARTP